jgi:hypothetical protein
VHRRSFIIATLAALTLPSIARAEPPEPPCGTATRNFQPSERIPGEPAALGITVRRQGGLVAPLPTADEILDANLDAGHKRAGIEYYIVGSQTLPAPEGLDMESLFLTWTTLEGAAAVKRTWGVAMLQQDGIRWTISVLDGHIGDIAGVLATTASLVTPPSPDTPAAIGSLLDLIPSETDLPGWEQADESLHPEPCGR